MAKISQLTEDPAPAITSYLETLVGTNNRKTKISDLFKSPAADLQIGAFASGNNQGGRLKLATDSPAIYTSFWTQTFDFTNGPPGEVNYSNHTWQIGYNSAWNGTKVVGGEVNFGLAFEPKFSTGGPFQTEIYITWGNPSGAISIRPWGMVIHHDTGSVTQQRFGHIHFFRDIGQGGGQSAEWNEQGWLRFYTANAAVTFPNNISGLKWMNAAGDNTLPPIWVDNADKVRLGFGSNIITSGSLQAGSIIGVSTLSGDGDSDTFQQWFGFGTIAWFSDGNQVFAVRPAYLELSNRPLVWETDGGGDIGFRGGTFFRPNNVYVKTNVEIEGVYKVDNVQVLGPQGAAVADATDASTAISQLNLLLARVRAHGLIAG